MKYHGEQCSHYHDDINVLDLSGCQKEILTDHWYITRNRPSQIVTT